MTAANPSANHSPDASTATLDDTFVDLTVNGHAVRIEAFEALDALAEVDRRHAESANECLDCGSLNAAGEACQCCRGQRLRATKAYRDDLVAVMRRELGLPEVSGRTALAIYERIAAVADAKKNASTTTPGSPGGSESPPVP